MEDQKRTGQTGAAKDRLMCKSEKAEMKQVYLTYVCVAIVVGSFQVFVYIQAGFHFLQILSTVACLTAVLLYMVKAAKDSKNWLHLYEQHFEIKEGRFSYAAIRDASCEKNILTLDLGRKRLFYASNAKELCQTIIQQKERMKTAKQQKGV